tara:strand:+ start:440 stop:826 length:387 start_codon:yes stop_codon:yes gene_type:complete
MAALNKDTRLIMTILFVGAMSGTNVYFYANYGISFPYTAFAHAILFGLLTVGSVMGMKAIFDLAINDRIELYLLDRRIKAYWDRRTREEQQRQKIRETMNMNQMSLNYMTPSYESSEISNEFLATVEQ